MPRKAYNIKMPDGNRFSFDYDTDVDGPLTKAKVADLYNKRVKPVQSEPEVASEGGLFSSLWRKATTPLLDIPEWGKSEGFFGNLQRSIASEDSIPARAANWANSRLLEPTTSPMGIASLPLGAARLGRLALGAIGTGFGLATSGDNISKAVENPTLENIGDAALSTSAIAAFPLAARRPILDATRPKATPSPDLKTVMAQADDIMRSRNTSTELPTVTRPDVNIPRLGSGPEELKSVGTYGIKPNTIDPQTGAPIRPSMRQSTNQQWIDRALPARTKELIGAVDKKSTPVKDYNPVAPEVEPVIIKAASSNNPILKEAANGVVNIEGKLRTEKSNIKKVTEGFTKSGLSILDEDSKAGKEISLLIQKTRALGDRIGGQWSDRFKHEVVKGLSDSEWETIRLAKEGKVNPGDLSPHLKDRLAKWEVLDSEVVGRAKSSGMKLERFSKDGRGGELVDFEGNENYFPRIYPEEFIKGKRVDVFDQLIKQGFSAEEANAMLDNSKKFGYRLISAQKQRHADVPGYRVDKEAYIKHLGDMGKRIAESENLGPRDLGDVNSPISKLVSQTNDKKRITDILSKHLGRVKTDEAAHNVANKIATYQAATKLGMFAISNQANKATIPIRGDLSAFYKAVKQYRATEGKRFAEQSGALQSAVMDVVNEIGGEGWVSKLYRTGASERANRSLASLTGKYTAENLYAKIKAGKGNAKDRSRLADLLYESPEKLDSIIGQQGLTEDQLALAGSRMSEITQGRAGSIDLPPYWTGHPATNVVTMFKKYAFRQTKMLKDAAKENPVKFITFGLPLLALTGEGIGDIKATVKGSLSGENLSEAIVNRGVDDGIVRNLMMQTGSKSLADLSGRIAENLSEAWTLGILGDLIESSSYQGGLLRFLAGPTLDSAGKILYGAGKAVRGDIKSLASHVVESTTPVPFSYPLGAKIRSNNKRGSGGGMPRLMPSLPRVNR